MRWARLDGWEPDPDRPGYLRDPHRPGWLRTPDGRWWDAADIDRALASSAVAAAVEEVGDQAEAEVVERVRRAAQEVLGRGH